MFFSWVGLALGLMAYGFRRFEYCHRHYVIMKKVSYNMSRRPLLYQAINNTVCFSTKRRIWQRQSNVAPAAPSHKHRSTRDCSSITRSLLKQAFDDVLHLTYVYFELCSSSHVFQLMKRRVKRRHRKRKSHAGCKDWYRPLNWSDSQLTYST